MATTDRRRAALVLGLCALLALAGRAHESNDAEDDDEDDVPVFAELVTCGSVFRLESVRTGRRLHSHDVKYGSGSGQQSVTGFAEAHDSNSLWVVHTFVGAEGGRECVQGAYLRDGASVKLTHLNTGKNLHSHAQHSSPLSGNQEVTAYGDSGVGDAGDRWILRLQPLEGDQRKRAKADGTEHYWHRGQKFRLEHADTGLFLAVQPKHTYGNPIPGQMEVCCLKSPKKADLEYANWRTAEGFFFPQRAAATNNNNSDK